MFTQTKWQSRRQQTAKHTGYSGVELLAAITSAIFVLFLGSPIYQFLTNRGPEHLLKIPSLASHLEYARQEAVREEATITICPSRDGRNCQVGGNWQMGWLIFIDEVSPSRHFSVGDTLLYRQRGHVELQPMVAAVDLIQYQPDGSINLE